MEKSAPTETGQTPTPTEKKFAAYEAANLAGGGTPNHELWASFTPEERDLWRQQAGSLMTVPGRSTKEPKVSK